MGLKDIRLASRDSARRIGRPLSRLLADGGTAASIHIRTGTYVHVSAFVANVRRVVTGKIVDGTHDRSSELSARSADHGRSIAGGIFENTQREA